MCKEVKGENLMSKVTTSQLAQDTVQEVINFGIKEQKLVLKNATELMANAPTGYLIEKKRKKGKSYYWNKYLSNSTNLATVGNKKVSLNITNDIQAIKKLVDKKVNIEKMKICATNISLMEAFQNSYQPYTLENLMKTLPVVYQNAINTINVDEMGKRVEREVKNLEWRSENRIHETICGIFVRSKSEVIIANALYMADIPFHYEERFPFPDEDGNFFYPDFTIILPNGKKIYWEHFGLLSKIGYCISAAHKLNVYQLNGVSIGKNLIITQDDNKGNCSSGFINKIVREYLCPHFE